MSTTVLHPRTIQTRGPSGSTIVAIVAGVVVAAVLGFSFANGGEQATQANPALAADAIRNEAGIQATRNPALAADALRNEGAVYGGLPRTDAQWSSVPDIVNRAPLSRFPRIDDHWSGAADVTNTPVAPVTKPKAKTYGPMHMSYADLVAFEGAGQSGLPRTDEHWSGQADVLIGTAAPSAETSEANPVGGGNRPFFIE